ncbi:hypothetical protein JOQ06_024099 [Pogonophryne albipinna]|uniref:Zinc finger BED domain-containing protein 4 n=1 Tax=Pogonophryne albipinna TaxID=1090488 RepID=A0AAD6BLG6_9TELE|nr:hypothetical protein JOQ06_024099 [Pogonophryne albipinna]
MLNVPKHKLIHDVPTRWNSSYDMVERYLEQQAAVYSALTEKALKKNKNINTLSDQDVRMAEEVIEVLKPLKAITTLMCTETTPSVSMILPLKTMLIKSMGPNEKDCPTVKEVKAAIRGSLKDRYTDPALQDFLHKCTAVDPRFKALSHMDNACREHIYNSLTTEIVAIEEQREATETAGAMSSAGRADPEESGESSSSSSSSHPPPPIRKSAMAELFGELFNTEERNKPTVQLVKGEVTSYMAADSTSLDYDPLACVTMKDKEGAGKHIHQKGNDMQEYNDDDSNPMGICHLQEAMVRQV